MALRALRIFLNPRLPGEQNSQKRSKTPNRDLDGHVCRPHLQTTFTDHICGHIINSLKLAEDPAQTWKSRAGSSEKGVILVTTTTSSGGLE